MEMEHDMSQALKLEYWKEIGEEDTNTNMCIDPSYIIKMKPRGGVQGRHISPY
jgi:hypothetical protein